MYKFLIWTSLVCAIYTHAHAESDILTITFNNKPPFFYFENGQAKGVVVERAKQILSKAGIPFRMEEQPFLRIIATLKAQQPNYVALGFSKTAEREAFVVFSEPIYRDKSPVLVIRRADYAKFKALDSFEQLVAKSQLTFGGKAGNAYPIDAQLRKMTDRDLRFTGEAITLPRLLLLKRFDFTLMYPEEYPLALDALGDSAKELSSYAYPDLPEGSYRYFLFSTTTPAATIKRVNAAINILDMR